MKDVLGRACQIYGQNFLLINLLMLCVWMPAELLFNYLNYNYPQPDDAYFYSKIGNFYFQLVGMIASTGILFCAREWSKGNTPTLASSLNSGVSYWTKIFITRAIVSILLVLGFAFLIVPGLYFMIRLSVAEPLVIAEGISGAAAARRSHGLTRDRFGEILLWWLCGWIPIIIVIALFYRLQCVGMFNNWMAQAFLSTLEDLLSIPPFYCLAWAIYYRLAEDEKMKRAAG